VVNEANKQVSREGQYGSAPICDTYTCLSGSAATPACVDSDSIVVGPKACNECFVVGRRGESMEGVFEDDRSGVKDRLLPAFPCLLVAMQPVPMALFACIE